MTTFSSESHKNGLVPENINSMSLDEIRNFVDSLDPDSMGFDGNESPSNLEEFINDNVVAGAIAPGTSIGNGLSLVDLLTPMNYSNRSNPKKYLVIHYTAGTVDNGTAAKANAIYFSNAYRGASAHFIVDCSSTVYRCVSEDLVSWHCGANTYYHPECRNSNSIGVEICSYAENGVYKFKGATYNNALTLCRYLVKKYNIPKDRVVMHWHVTHKICAAPFISNGKPSQVWENFKNEIYSGNTINTNNDIKITPMNSDAVITGISPTSKLNVRTGPGTNYDIIGRYKLNDRVSIVGVCGDWYKLNNNGFIMKEYATKIHWADEFRDKLFNLKIITDKEQWSNYNKNLTKALLIALISNIVGGKLKDASGNEHWAYPALNNLIDKKVITDKKQWTDFETPVSKALFLAVIDKATCGGQINKYVNRATDHWGRNHLDSLCDKGIIDTPSAWTDFESAVKYDITLALIYKSLNKFNK